MTVVIVAGGRVGRNLTKGRVWRILDERSKDWVKPITIVHGDAVYTDQWAGQWAVFRGHREKRVPIRGDLDGYREKAPFNRNQRMFDEQAVVDECLGFPGGNGTLNMMDICHKAGVPVGDIEIEADGEYTIKWWPQ
ncbi:GTP-binding domain [Caulobacter phage CcrColossus]|uniref:Uncharacterized protein n=1 Tax=Caulobacter phage CcrColossus TaxID=1211640 RepID=K4K6A9_9CAUD|nr:GTP-binding domain [Caulobacter phage CcrColossus]AFU88062.1 hypothetical protein CcrColossus_gp192 [Caulobacter phage CcrColossus]